MECAKCCGLECSFNAVLALACRGWFVLACFWFTISFRKKTWISTMRAQKGQEPRRATRPTSSIGDTQNLRSVFYGSANSPCSAACQGFWRLCLLFQPLEWLGGDGRCSLRGQLPACVRRLAGASYPEVGSPLWFCCCGGLQKCSGALCWFHPRAVAPGGLQRRGRTLFQHATLVRLAQT